MIQKMFRSIRIKIIPGEGPPTMTPEGRCLTDNQVPETVMGSDAPEQAHS